MKQSVNSCMQLAFSLVELSIVLVILGLLTGGILTGQSLIKAAELRSITTEYSSFQTSVNTFKGKYASIPGDMTNGTLFWGKLSAYCNGDTGTAAANGTCNGDGDGVVEKGGGGSQPKEMFMFWKQLNLAGLIEGNYTGIAGSANDYDHDTGINCPASKYSSGAWGLDPVSGSSSSNYVVTYTNVFEFGKERAADDVDDKLLTPEEAWNIDKKLDDGRPAYGRVIAKYWNNACGAANDGSHASNDLDASYKLSDKDAECALIFNNSF